MEIFHREDAKAICKIHLSHRQVSNSVVWLHNRKGVYSVRSRYYLERRVMQKEDWAESSRGPGGLQIWKKLWKLRVPNKIKVFGWRACHKILPTLLFDANFELFLVRSWLIWNQRNKMVHGGQMMDPRWLNKRALDYLDEYKKSQVQLIDILVTAPARISWQPPPPSIYKLNFDAAIFSYLNCSRFGAIIHNEEGQVMAWMSVKDPLVHNSAEAEALACRRAVEFSIEAGFSRLVNEGDNTLFPELSWEGSSGNNQLVGTGMMMTPKIHGMDNIQHEDNSKNHGISVATQQIEAEKKGTEDVDTRNYHGLKRWGIQNPL
ncbi:hypothetical protein RGQ29_019178 [Quercus rubra]|uniref:RNase H type-1 domain-containing protein n=1 Tax=Quercus rubra TaxID=3512 RepID=A0AAN7F7U1_QUERU|nr:hypothetical protein RGQ29_019178 [Quercus rubra]